MPGQGHGRGFRAALLLWSFAGVFVACASSKRDFGQLEGTGGLGDSGMGGRQVGGAGAGGFVESEAGASGSDTPSAGDAGAGAGTSSDGGAGGESGGGGASGACGSLGPAARDCTSHLDNDCDGVLDDAIDGVCQCTASSCSTDTTCRLSPSSSQCVACLRDSDCGNGATCASNVCQCKAGFNGNRCQYQKFRGVGGALGDGGGSFAINISPDGSTVVGYSQITDLTVRHPWRFAGNVLNVIPRPPGKTYCSARATDSGGSIYGSCEGSSFQYLNGTTSVFSFSTYTAYAFDVSRDGKVVVGYADFDGQQAIRNSGATTTLIPKLGTDFSAAYATNADGSVVVGDEYVASHVGWYWTQKSGTTKLAQLSDFGNYDPTDVSGDGKVIVGYEYAGSAMNRAVKWSGNGFATIDTKPGQYNSTNYDGKVVVGYTGADYANRVATVWDESGPHPISGYVEPATLSGWTLSEAVAVSDDGKWLAGNGMHNGTAEPWVVHLP